MHEINEQAERLDTLVKAFREDSVQYRDLPTPADDEGKRRLLRSLMNIRMPGRLPADVIRIQDAYLRARATEKGIVALDDIPVIKSSLSLWQGDITRLAVDAIVNAANSQKLGCFVPMQQLHSHLCGCSIASGLRGTDDQAAGTIRRGL